MFNLHDSLMENYFKAIGHWADYDVFLRAAGWHKIGVLTEEDLAEIQTAIEAQYPIEPEEGVIENG